MHHPWMKLAKLIGRFKTDNDGVVTDSKLRNSRARSWAVNLGVVDADHLAGIAASDFPQGPF